MCYFRKHAGSTSSEVEDTRGRLQPPRAFLGRRIFHGPSMSICGTTTLTPPEMTAAQPSLAQLPGLPRDQGGPVFAEPWQASAFALAVSLSQQGHFSWKEWAAALAEELKASSARGEPDDGSHYYHCWLTALERLVVAKRLKSGLTV